VVKLKVHVSAAGKALQVQLFKSSGFSRLDEAALDAVKGWNFVPAKQGDQSIEGWVIVPISFKLRS
jgi:periplasmic protein TonB